MLPFGVELRAYDLDLIDGLGFIAEFAWRTEAIRIRRRSKPELIDPSKGKVQFDLVTGAVFTEVEWHLWTLMRVVSEEDINRCDRKRDSG